MNPQISNTKRARSGPKGKPFELAPGVWVERIKLAEQLLLILKPQVIEKSAPFAVVTASNLTELPKQDLLNWAVKYKNLLDQAFNSFDLPKIIKDLKNNGLAGEKAYLQGAYSKHGLIMPSTKAEAFQIDPFYLLAEQLSLHTLSTLGAVLITNQDDFIKALQSLKTQAELRQNTFS